MWSYEKAVVRGGRSWGQVYLDLQGMERSGRCFYTDVLDAGLGAGMIYLSFAVVDQGGYDQGLLSEGRLLYGDAEVFAQSSYVPGVPAVKLGAWVDPSKGVFRLGVCLLSHAVQCRLAIRWWAQKMDSEDDGEKEEGENLRDDFYIKTMPKMMKVGRKFQFSCVKPDDDDVVEWRVLSPGGGSIDRAGMYTAPDNPGIYQIQAVLPDKGRETSIYLMVK